MLKENLEEFIAVFQKSYADTKPAFMKDNFWIKTRDSGQQVACLNKTCREEDACSKTTQSVSILEETILFCGMCARVESNIQDALYHLIYFSATGLNSLENVVADSDTDADTTDLIILKSIFRMALRLYTQYSEMPGIASAYEVTSAQLKAWTTLTEVVTSAAVQLLSAHTATPTLWEESSSRAYFVYNMSDWSRGELTFTQKDDVNVDAGSDEEVFIASYLAKCPKIIFKDTWVVEVDKNAEDFVCLEYYRPLAINKLPNTSQMEIAQALWIADGFPLEEAIETAIAL